MINKKYCEHELNFTDEEWLSEDKVRITLKCDLCKAKFEGVVKEKK